MDDDVGLNFDFEGGLDAVTAGAGSAAAIQGGAGMGSGGGGQGPGPGSASRGQGSTKRSYRQTVCRHWLRGLCMKGADCGFLHQYDKSRMPLCRFFARFGECREADCIYKHSAEDIKECNMYKSGFCPNGPDCRYRHEKLPGPPPPVEQHLASFRQRYQKNNNTPQSDPPPPRQQNFESPQGGYSNPQGGYAQQGGYSTPQGAYSIPQANAQSGYSNPHGGYSNGSRPQKMMASAASPLPYGAGYSR